MYRKISSFDIPIKGIKEIAATQCGTSIHELWNVTGNCVELKQHMKDMAYKEVGQGDNDVTINTPVKKDTNILLLCPTVEILSNASLLQNINDISVNSYIIAVMQDVEPPYDDSCYKFFSILRTKYELRTTRRININNSIENKQSDHKYSIYLLKRLPENIALKKPIKESYKIEVENGQYVETQYVPPTLSEEDSFPSIDNPVNYQHPVLTIRRMPILMNKKSKAVDYSYKNTALDKHFNIDLKRNDVQYSTDLTKMDYEGNGFILTKAQIQKFEEENAQGSRVLK